jgi:DNA-binding HxlR family transcriptional regulator
MVPDKARRTALFLIFSELLQGNELGLDYLTKRYGTFTRESIGRSTIQRLLRLLQDDGIIKVDIYGHRTTKRAHHYTLTPVGHDLARTSSKAYWTYDNYNRNRGSITSGDPNLKGNYHIPEHDHYADWLEMLPKSKETDRFIDGLFQLESYELIFRRYEANQNPAMVKHLHQVRNLPSIPFQEIYRPLRSGRLQGVPHPYIGKELVHYIRPVDDPHLSEGILFSLDFSSQELRILASLLPADSLVHQWALNPGNHFSELLAMYNIDMPPHLWKGFMYSFLYGSQGWALADQMSHEEATKIGEFSRIAAARSIVNDFTKKVPELVSLREHYSGLFIRDHAITAPGGVTRHVNSQRDLTTRGQVKKNSARSIPLSHIIQGTGAYIAREIIARAQQLKYSRLHIPIHDGFVFYCSRELFNEAIVETGKLMTDVANDIIPNIEIPHKIEWSKGGTFSA